jgi:lipid-binding SYLF domain-containing protein
MSCSEGWNLKEFNQKSMKARTILAVAAAAITLTSSALGDKYSDLVAKGYRWAIADGLYACVSKDDVRRMVNNPTSPAGDEVG